MAITKQYSTEYKNRHVTTPAVIGDSTEYHGRVRIQYFSFTQDGAGDATSSFLAVRLPGGIVRIVGGLSKIYAATATASATLDVGWDAYTDLEGDTVVADPNGIDDGIDTDTVGFFELGSALAAEGGTKKFTSKGGVDIRITSQDVALADGDTVSGYIAYVTD